MNSDKESKARETTYLFTTCKTKKYPQNTHYKKPEADMNFQPLAF